MNVLITIPARNEALVIAQNVQVLCEAVRRLLPQHDVRIEVVDNGSTDGTAIAAKAAGIEALSVFELREPGKGGAIRASWLRHADSADIFLFMDADLAVALEDMPKLLEPLEQGEADLVCGSRFMDGAVVTRSWLRERVSRAYRALQCVVLHLPVDDAQCGFKAISRAALLDAVPRCEERAWLFDTELIALAQRRGFRVKEIPITWVEKRIAARRSSVSVLRHGLGFVFGVIRIRLRHF